MNKRFSCKNNTNLIFDYFKKNNLSIIDISILQPSDPFLDIVGENLRRQIFITENEYGESICLRPEFTIPVCLKYIKNKSSGIQKYAYSGEVFLQRRKIKKNPYQAGIEVFGEDDELKADARSLYSAISMIAYLSPKEIAILLGDHAIFSSVLSSLLLPNSWKKKILRCFGNNTHLKNLLKNLSKPIQRIAIPESIRNFVSHRNFKNLEKYLEENMLKAGISPTSGRTPREISERLIEKVNISNFQLKKSVLNVLEDFLEINVSLDQAERTLKNFSDRYQLNLKNAIKNFSERIQQIIQQGIDINTLRYCASFGRNLNYYTGFVYEIYDNKKNNLILAGGGRYNNLLKLLGEKKPIPAVGFSIWIDRLYDN